MFSGVIDVKALKPADINQQLVNDINFLLKQQHKKADEVHRKKILEHLGKSVIVVALNDNRVVGIGILIRGYCLSHSFGSIHNLIIRDDYDVLTIGMRILKLLITDIYDLNFIEAGTWLQDDRLVDILKAVGFVEKPKFRYKFKLM